MRTSLHLLTGLWTSVWMLNAACPCPANAQEDFNERQEELLKELEWPGSQRQCIGITRGGTRLWCIMDADALDYRYPAPRLLAVAGLSGRSVDWEDLVRATKHAVSRRKETGAHYRMAVIPLANPDGYFQMLKTGNGAGGNPENGYPPQGTAYNSPTDPEKFHVWRFIGWFAPDLVIEVQGEEHPQWKRVLNKRSADHAWPKDSLAGALADHAPARIGQVPAIRFVTWSEAPESDEEGQLRIEYIGLDRLSGNPFLPESTMLRSPAREEMLRRLDRTPLEVLEQLSACYGGDLKIVSYQPALAVLCRLRLVDAGRRGELLEEASQTLMPYLEGTQPALSGNFGGSHLAGHLVFADWATRTQDQRAIELVQKAADFGFDEHGQPREQMPFHSEMSDAVFMSCPLLCAAGRLTGKRKYFEMAERHLTFMQELCLRKDGIYRHSPLDEAAWGRGNGFPALGLMISLCELDSAISDGRFAADRERLQQIHTRMQRDLVRHLGALGKFQDATGMWRQVIDEPGSYLELTATCMIGSSIAEGIRRGWLPSDPFAPMAERAWEAVKLRVGSDGTLLDVCTGTGKQRSLRDYLDRTALLSVDERGGAMAMLFSSHMALWKQ